MRKMSPPARPLRGAAEEPRQGPAPPCSPGNAGLTEAFCKAHAPAHVRAELPLIRNPTASEGASAARWNKGVCHHLQPDIKRPIYNVHMHLCAVTHSLMQRVFSVQFPQLSRGPEVYKKTTNEQTNYELAFMKGLL